MSALRPGRSDRRALWLIAVSAVVLLAGGVAIGLLAEGNDQTVRVSLTGTDLAPGASAAAELDDERGALRIHLDISRLAPAPDGSHYQLWVHPEADFQPDRAVVVGSFHLRGGDDEVTMSAGVSATDFPHLTVTLQPVPTATTTSVTPGPIVLRSTE